MNNFHERFMNNSSNFRRGKRLKVEINKSSQNSEIVGGDICKSTET